MVPFRAALSLPENCAATRWKKNHFHFGSVRFVSMDLIIIFIWVYVGWKINVNSLSSLSRLKATILFPFWDSICDTIVIIVWRLLCFFFYLFFYFLLYRALLCVVWIAFHIINFFLFFFATLFFFLSLSPFLLRSLTFVWFSLNNVIVVGTIPPIRQDIV